MRGSVGIEIPKPMSRLLMLMASGVKKVISKIILSRDTKYSRATNNTTGMNAPQR
jgi:hypothetical protein